jgi:uncharacterized protein YbjT (DUF2867 family)
VYPLAEGLLEAITVFAAAAKEAGVESIVNMSQITARADFPSQAARQYWLGERILDWSGIGGQSTQRPLKATSVHGLRIAFSEGGHGKT